MYLLLKTSLFIKVPNDFQKKKKKEAALHIWDALFDTLGWAQLFLIYMS